jgi:hypothetical protein
MLVLPITANIAPSLLILFTLMMEVIHSCKTSVLTRATWRHIPDDGILDNKYGLNWLSNLCYLYQSPLTLHNCTINSLQITKTIQYSVRFEVFMEATMKNGVFWDVNIPEDTILQFSTVFPYLCVCVSVRQLLQTFPCSKFRHYGSNHFKMNWRYIKSMYIQDVLMHICMFYELHNICIFCWYQCVAAIKNMILNSNMYLKHVTFILLNINYIIIENWETVR